MKRRSFIAGFLAAISTAAIPLPAFAASPTKMSSKMSYALDNYPKMLRVVETFPKIDFLGNGQLERMSFMIMKKCPDNMGITIESQVADPSKEFTLDKIFLEDDITTLEYCNTRPMINAIISGANRVAAQTRRGKGNYYAIFSDHVLVWYQSKNSHYDVPVQMIGKNLVYNPNYKDYFVRVKCDNKLTDEHIQHLEKLGYTRV
jgi:hypothetical protein